MNNLTLTPIQGEPRIQDLLLGERLGFERPRDIRKIIERNLENLNKINRCATVSRRPENGGRQVTEYYLDRKQSIFITMKSDAPRAFDVQMEIIEVYDAWQRGALGGQQPTAELVTFTGTWKDYALLMEAKTGQCYRAKPPAKTAARGGRARGYRPPLTDARKAQIIALYQSAENLSETEIGRRVGCSRQTVHRVIDLSTAPTQDDLFADVPEAQA